MLRGKYRTIFRPKYVSFPLAIFHSPFLCSSILSILIQPKNLAQFLQIVTVHVSCERPKLQWPLCFLVVWNMHDLQPYPTEWLLTVFIWTWWIEAHSTTLPAWVEQIWKGLQGSLERAKKTGHWNPLLPMAYKPGKG